MEARGAVRLWCYAAVLVVALAVRFAFWNDIAGSALDAWHRWPQSDMATYLEQGRRLAAGDWLGREPYHPYHLWQSAASSERWRRWSGVHVFHQAPAYSYLLAVLRGNVPATSDRGLAGLKTAQLLLGGLTAVLLAALAWRLAGPVAALVAGLLAAIYGPLLYLEPQLLRDGPACAATAGILLALLSAVGRPSPRLGRAALRAAAIGALVGVFATFHELGTVLLAAAAVVFLVRSRAFGAAGLALPCALAAGFLVGFAPLLARNLAVGAPALSVSCRAAVNLALSNAADAPAAGAVFAPPSATQLALLDRAADAAGRVTLGGALREVWNSHAGHRGRMLAGLGARFLRLWIPREIPDNTSFYFYREHSPVLRATATFSWIMPPALAAIVGVLWGLLRRRGPDPSPARAAARRQHAVALWTLACVLGSMTLVHSVGRFRLYLALFLLLYAGVFAGRLVEALRQHRVREIAAALALACAAALALAWSGRTARVPARGRAADYATAGQIALQLGRPEEAVAHLERRSAFPDRLDRVFLALGFAESQLGRWDRAVEAYERALRESPGDPTALRALEEARRRRDAD